VRSTTISAFPFAVHLGDARSSLAPWHSLQRLSFKRPQTCLLAVDALRAISRCAWQQSFSIAQWHANSITKRFIR